jgi:hypothetical protein
VNVVSDAVFSWFLTFLVGGLSAAWLVYDIRNLTKLRGADARDALVRDRRFGYIVGIVVALIGLVGTARYHGLV